MLLLTLCNTNETIGLVCQKEKEIVHFRPHGDFQNEKYEEQFRLSLLD